MIYLGKGIAVRVENSGRASLLKHMFVRLDKLYII